MNHHSSHKAIEELKKIRMTDAEKSLMLARIVTTPVIATKPAHHASVKSPWSVYSFRLWIERNSLTSIAVVLAVMLLAGGGIASAAQGALPGDALYAFKVNVTEPIRVALAPTPQAKAQVQADLANTRLQEAETLAVRGTLTAPKQAQIQDLLTKQTAALNSSLATVAEASSSADASNVEAIRSRFAANMNAHARILDLIATHASTTDQAQTFSVADIARQNAAKVFAFTQDNQGNDNGNGASRHRSGSKGQPAMATSLVPMITGTSTSASVSSSTGPSPRIGHGQNGHNGAYDRHRQSVESLIKGTQQDLNTIQSSTTSWDQSVASGTQATLNQADQSLNAADQANNNGEATSADERLLQSDQAATEATIFLNTGLKFRGKF